MNLEVWVTFQISLRIKGITIRQMPISLLCLNKGSFKGGKKRSFLDVERENVLLWEMLPNNTRC